MATGSRTVPSEYALSTLSEALLSHNNNRQHRVRESRGLDARSWLRSDIGSKEVSLWWSTEFLDILPKFPERPVTEVRIGYLGLQERIDGRMHVQEP